MNKKIKDILLWFFILPASFASMVLTWWLWAIIHNRIASYFVDTSTSLPHILLLVDNMNYLIYNAVFVFVGYKVAPNNQKIVAIVLTALVILMSVAAPFFYGVSFIEFLLSTQIIAGICGAVLCCIGICLIGPDKKK